MAEKQFTSRIVTRHATAEEFAAVNPILLAGEVAITMGEVKDDGTKTLPKFKVGDGTTPWNDLDYCVDTEAVLAKLEELELTAENTYFTSDLTFTYQFGKYTPSNGSVTVPATNKSVYDVLMDAYSQAEDPDVTAPAVSIVASGSSDEVGKTFTPPTATLKVTSVGSYTYGSKDAANTEYAAEDTGVVFEKGNITLTCGTAEATNNSNFTTGNTMTLKAVSDNTTYGDTAVSFTFSATAKHTASADREPVNNLGAKVPALKIQSGDTTVTNATATFTGIRKCFYGYKLVADAIDPTAVDSATIRGLQKCVTTLPSSYTVPKDTKQVFFAAKAGKYNSLTIKNTSALSAPVACTKVASGVDVEGANGYTAVAYDYWYVNLDSAFSDSAALSLAWN